MYKKIIYKHNNIMRSHFITSDFSSQNQEHVFQLQEALLLFYNNSSLIASYEIRERIFGDSTRNALIAFQEENRLIGTGRVDFSTIEEINLRLSKYNKVLGTVRDIAGTPLEGVSLRVFVKDKDNDNEIGQSISFNDGSYCVFFPFLNSNVRRTKSGVFQIIVKVYKNNEEIPVSKAIFVEKMGEDIVVDFSSDQLIYQGTSVYDDIKNDILETNSTLLRYIIGGDIGDVPNTIVEDIIYISKISGNTTDSIVKFLLANKISRYNDLNSFGIPAELFFAFLYQNYPANIQTNLLPETDLNGEELVLFLTAHFTKLEETARTGIVLLYDVVKDEDSNYIGLFNAVIETAKKLHYIPIYPITEKDYTEYYGDIFAVHNDYILKKPLLVGDDPSYSQIGSKFVGVVTEADKLKIAKLFTENNGDIIALKNAVKANGTLNGIDISQFELAGITQNHADTINAIKTNIGTTKKLSDYTKNDLSKLITSFPEEFESKDSYLKDISLNIQKLYPVESYFTHIEKLCKTSDILNDDDCRALGFISATNYNALKEYIKNKENNIDILTHDANEIPEEDLKKDFKIIQQAYRMSPTPATAGALINEKIHSVKQIYLLGKDNLKEKLSIRNISDEEVDMLYSMTTARYANALAAFSNINSNFNQIDPLAISTLTKEKLDKLRGDTTPTSSEELIRELIAEFPNIATLFGSTDYCDCQHCQSVYSPSAYLADVLTFLESKRSELPNISAEDVLTAPNRRGDIEAIKLNCQNADTPMPYIDLACEILEENIAPQNPPTANQTTLTAEELKAMPEHVNKGAYSVLRTASYPMNSSFNLWQEESKTYLAKMGIKRYELMEAFKGADIDIAAEYFGLTTVEKNIIITNPTGTLYPNNNIWTNVTIDFKIAVSDFLRDTGLNCNEVLELKDVKWLGITINLDNDSCSCDDKVITFNNAATLDKTHRFIRLWRKSGYKMWELDLLLSKKGIYGEIAALVLLDAQFLINLKKFDELKKLLNLSFENLLAIYNPINTETRKVNNKSEVALYNRLFLNNNLKKIVNSDIQVNSTLKGFDIFNIDSTTKNLPKIANSYFLIYDNINTELNTFIKNVITAAFSISESDYVLLLDNLFKSTANKDLKIENLSFIYRNVIIAKQLKLSISDFIKLFDLLKTDTTAQLTPFQSVNKTFEFINLYNEIKKAGLNTDDLNYLTYYLYNADFSAIPTNLPALAQPNSFYNDAIKKLRETLAPVFELTDKLVLDNTILIKSLLSRFPLFINADNSINTSNVAKVEQLIKNTLPATDIDECVTKYLNPFIKDLAAAKLFFKQSTPPTELEKWNYILKSLFLST